MADALTARVNVRYMVDNVDAATDFYTTHLGSTLGMNAAPAFADVARGRHRPGGQQILLGGPSGNVVELFQPAAGR